MVTQVIITYKDGTIVRNSGGLALMDFCTKLKYSSKEKVSSDSCDITLIFENFSLANSFNLRPGINFLVRYGISSNLTNYRNLVIDHIKKTVNKAGITFELTLIPLIDYVDRNQQDPAENPWDKIQKLGADLKLSFSLPKKHTFYWEVFAESKKLKPDPKPDPDPSSGFTVPLTESAMAWNTQAGAAAAMVKLPEDLAEKYYDELFNPVAFAGSTLKQLEEAVSRYEALIADSRDDELIIKERDLTRNPDFSLDVSGLLASKNPDRIISYTLDHSDSAVRSESMVQASVDFKTKELGITKVSSLPDEFMELPIFHVGKADWLSYKEREASQSPGLMPTLAFKVLTNGTSFYMLDDSGEYANELSGDEVELIRQQINHYWDATLKPLSVMQTLYPSEAFSRYATALTDEQAKMYDTVIKSQLTTSVEKELGELPGFAQIEPMEVDAIQGHKYTDPKYPDIYSSVGINRFMSVYGSGFEDGVSEREAREILAHRAEGIISSTLPLHRKELTGALIKETVDEALNKRKLQVKFEGAPGFEVGKILFFKSALDGETGRFYLTEVEDTVTGQGFLTKIEGLKVPKQIAQSKQQFLTDPDKAWEEVIDRVSGGLLDDANDLIDGTLLSMEAEDLSQVPLIEVEIIKASEEVDKSITVHELPRIRRLPKK